MKLVIDIPGYALSMYEPDIPQEIKFLVEAYGPPKDQKQVPFQNSYGAKWDCLEAVWLMSDGVGIVAGERIRNTDHGPRRGLSIMFVPKDETPKPPVINPYIAH